MKEGKGNRELEKIVLVNKAHEETNSENENSPIQFIHKVTVC